MKLGIVIGKLVSDKKEGKLKGKTILVVSYLDEKMKDTKKTVACVDTVNAGAGEVVILCSSSSARLTDKTKNVATDNTIVGIVDSISIGKEYSYKKK